MVLLSLLGEEVYHREEEECHQEGEAFILEEEEYFLAEHQELLKRFLLEPFLVEEEFHQVYLLVEEVVLEVASPVPYSIQEEEVAVADSKEADL